MNEEIKISENMAKIIRSLKRYEAIAEVIYLGHCEDNPDCEVIRIRTKDAHRFPWKSRPRIEAMINKYGYRIIQEYGCDCGPYDERDFYLIKERDQNA